MCSLLWIPNTKNLLFFIKIPITINLQPLVIPYVEKYAVFSETPITKNLQAFLKPLYEDFAVYCVIPIYHYEWMQNPLPKLRTKWINQLQIIPIASNQTALNDHDMVPLPPFPKEWRISKAITPKSNLAPS